jgi:hypothetical protein
MSISSVTNAVSFSSLSRLKLAGAKNPEPTTAFVADGGDNSSAGAPNISALRQTANALNQINATINPPVTANAIGGNGPASPRAAFNAFIQSLHNFTQSLNGQSNPHIDAIIHRMEQAARGFIADFHAAQAAANANNGGDTPTVDSSASLPAEFLTDAPQAATSQDDTLASSNGRSKVVDLTV